MRNQSRTDMNEQNQRRPTSPPNLRARSGRRLRLLRGLPVVILLTLALAACSVSTSGTNTPGSTSTANTATATSTTESGTSGSGPTVASTPTTSTATSTPAASSSSSVSTTTTSSSSATPTTGTTPTGDVIAAVKQVIQQANQEQIQALAQKDPTLMKDTTTSAGYLQFEQDLQSLTSAGVTSIDLKDLKWGNITQQDASTVKVTTTETWDATAANSVTQQQSDTNVYTLVLLNGSWKITSDEHPDVGGGQSASGSGTQPGTTTIPVDRLSQSENWAGYAATGGTFTDVSATWTVPNVSNTTDSSADATWVGIGGVTSTDLIQAGTEAIVQGQEVSYSAWIETLPQSEKQVALAVSPGDQVNVSIDQQSSGVWQIVMKNLTTGQTYQTTVNYQSSLSSAEWIEESPSAGWAQVPLDDFGSVSFSNATAVENGQTVSIDQANGKAITLASRNGQALAQTSDLGSDGSSFSVTRTDVSSSQYPSGGRGFQRRGYPGT